MFTVHGVPRRERFIPSCVSLRNFAWCRRGVEYHRHLDPLGSLSKRRQRMHVLKHHQPAPTGRHAARIAWSVALLAVIVLFSAWAAWQPHPLATAIAPVPGVNDERSMPGIDTAPRDQAADGKSSGMTASEFQRMYEGDSAANRPLWAGF
jgi:hypothetical protein